MEKKRYKFSLRKKLVIFTTTLAIITYSCSAIFIYVLYPFVFKDMFNPVVFNLGTLTLGVIWSGILAFFAAHIIIKPLKDLENAAMKAAGGDVSENVKVSKSDDEIRAVGLAFNYMLENIRKMVKMIEENFKETNEKVISISKESSRATEQAEISHNIEISKGKEHSLNRCVTTESVDEIITIVRDVQNKAKDSEEISNEMLEC